MVAGQSSYSETTGIEHLSELQGELVRQSSQLSPRNGHSGASEEDMGISPGDICTLVDRRCESQTEWMCVLIHRFCTVKDSSPSARLLWIRQDSNAEIPRSWRYYCQSVHSVAMINTCPRSDTRRITQQHDSVGTLDNGEKYVVYRILLYSDDFETRSDYNPTGSNGGCYMLPLNLPPCDQRSRSAVRFISVTLPCVSTNQILEAIVPDLVRGMTESVVGQLPNGENVRIFLDVLGFIGNYPASCYVIDSKTHTAAAPCTLCNFRRYSGPQTRASKYGYTIQLNANDSSACRFGDRHEALRADGIDDETARLMGMTPSSSVKNTTCPLVAFQRELQKARTATRRNSHGQTVVTAMFDAYRSNLVAPDHLLTGLGKNIISLLLGLTPAQVRSHIDIRICDELERNGLLRQRSILKSNWKGLVSMGLSAVFCKMLVAGPVFETIYCNIGSR